MKVEERRKKLKKKEKLKEFYLKKRLWRFIKKNHERKI